MSVKHRATKASPVIQLSTVVNAMLLFGALYLTAYLIFWLYFHY